MVLTLETHKQEPHKQEHIVLYHKRDNELALANNSTIHSEYILKTNTESTNGIQAKLIWYCSYIYNYSYVTYLL